MSKIRVLKVSLLAVVAFAVGSSTTQAADAPEPTKIEVLSSRADLVSDGQALVKITLPARAKDWKPSVTVRSRRVTDQLTRVDDRTMLGVVSGLRKGRNLMIVRLPDSTGAAIALYNHPGGGPVFSGPQIQPWKCQKDAVDDQCNQPVKYEYKYKSTNPFKFGLQDYDIDDRPSDVATTTAENGTKVPFIVRVETGYVARDQYKIAALYNPDADWSAVAPQKQYAHKLLITHGASCDIAYEPGGAPSVTKYTPIPIPLISPDVAETALGRGYAVMSTAANNSGHNCNVVTQAESMLMAKERVIEQYGTVRFTIGAGCSGGSLATYWVANAYPGLYQGILPTCTFPDAWSSASQVGDYHLLRNYFEKPERIIGFGITWSPDQWAEVEGSVSPLNSIISDLGFYNAIIPDRECDGLTEEQTYNAKTNPTGVRCSIADYSINIFGPRREEVRYDVEKKIGKSFGAVPIDNIGVQYGLKSLLDRKISVAQFVDLNAKIGGVDWDGKPYPLRINGDLDALDRAYRSGSINETNNLDQTAIIDCRGPDPGFAHDSYRPYAVRARLDRANGGHENQLIWEGSLPLVADLNCASEGFKAMDRWLEAVAADTSAKTLEEKVAGDRPADLSDRCYDGGGMVLGKGRCAPDVVPIYGTPRMVAGDGITTDNNKCQLKPLKRSDYPVSFSDSQWRQMESTFPSGVCDYSKLGVGQQPTIPWLTYQDTKGRVIYGGTPMPPAPESVALN